MSLITDLAAAMIRQEGSYQLGTAGQRYNNPGNLMDLNHAIWPQYPTAPSGEVIFPDPATGLAAMQRDLSIKIARGMTLSSLITMYAPPSQNDTATYIANVALWTGLPTDVPLNTLDQSGVPATIGTTPVTPVVDPATGLPDFTDSISSDPSESGTVDWTTIGLVGLGAFLVWYLFDEYF
jgi:hypothetical protein